MAKLVKYTGFFLEMNCKGPNLVMTSESCPPKNASVENLNSYKEREIARPRAELLFFHKKSACFSVFVFGVVKPSSLSQNNEILILEKRLISSLIYYFP